MRVFLNLALVLFCCVRDSRGNIFGETERRVENKHEVSETDRTCSPDMCELLMKIGGMEARLEATEAMEDLLKATEQQLAILQTENKAIVERLTATETKNAAMEARLAATEMQVAILQTGNEAMEDRLKATEQQVAILQPENGDLDARLKATEQQMVIVQTENEAMEDRLKAAERQVAILQSENGDIDSRLKATEQRVVAVQTENEELTVAVDSSVSQLRDVHTRLNSIETHLHQLLETSAKSKVAFSAGFGGEGDYGPFNTDTTLKYNDVQTNIGYAYSPNTGTFTAPVHGVYHFSFYHHHSVGDGGAAFLYKNKAQVLAVTYGYNKDGQYNTANGVTVLLEEGDEVNVLLEKGQWIYDNGKNFSNFNGILLFTL